MPLVAEVHERLLEELLVRPEAALAALLLVDVPIVANQMVRADPGSDLPQVAYQPRPVVKESRPPKDAPSQRLCPV
jgi:hypothetical protein